MSETVEKIADKLLESFPTVLVIIGSALLLLGLASGIQYQGWLPINGFEWRLASAGTGGVIFILGVAFYRQKSAGSLRIKSGDFKIVITSPINGAHVNSHEDVRGTFDKAPPEGFTLRVFRIYPSEGRFISVGQATFDLERKTWEARGCHVAGSVGETRQLAAVLVGPAGAALIAYFDEAQRPHNKLMDQYQQATNQRADFLPPIRQRTPDMTQCSEIWVVRK